MAWPTIMCKQPWTRAEMPPVPVLMMNLKMSQGRSGAERNGGDLKVVLANWRYSSMAWPTIMCKWPRKRAEMPPVPVLTMKSKTLQGRSDVEGESGMLDVLVYWSCSMSSQSEVRP